MLFIMHGLQPEAELEGLVSSYLFLKPQNDDFGGSQLLR